MRTFSDILTFLILFIFVASTIISKEQLKNEKIEKAGAGVKTKYIGESPHADAVNWGYANNDGYVLASNAGFVNPKIMGKIPQNLNQRYTGVMAEANGIKSGGKFYYDGTSNLSALHVNCNVMSTNPDACIHNSNCGWCGSSNSCVQGNNSGPLGNCLRSTYLYTKPSNHWNPLKAGTINILAQAKSGGSALIITPEPNLKKIGV